MTWRVDVRVEPDGPAEAGSTVWVWVKAESSEAATCRAIHCEVKWMTGGRGTSDQGVVFTKDAPGGNSQPGSPLTAEFTLAVPAAGPVSYQGRLIAIGWTVRAWLDIAWATDPEGTVPLIVVPRKG